MHYTLLAGRAFLKPGFWPGFWRGQFGRVRQKGSTVTGPPRHRVRLASAKGALQPQPSANGLGIVTHKIQSSEGANQSVPPSPARLGVVVDDAPTNIQRLQAFLLRSQID